MPIIILLVAISIPLLMIYLLYSFLVLPAAIELGIPIWFLDCGILFFLVFALFSSVSYFAGRGKNEQE